MIEQPKKDSLALPVSGVLLVLAAAVGLNWFDRPLKSRRPQQPEPYARDTFGDQDVRARLWQDPFEPVFTDFSAPEASNKQRDADDSIHELASLAEKIWIRTGMRVAGEMEADKDEATLHPTLSRAKTEQQLVLMPVLVSGSSLAEDAETRRRTRQAIVSALAVKGFVPAAGERIGYIETHWDPPGRLTSGKAQVTVPIPFEWFQRDLLRPQDQRPDAEWVLVLWIDEELLQDYALLRLNELLGNLVSFQKWRRISDHLRKTRTRQAEASGDEPPDPVTTAAQPLDVDEICKRIQLRLIGPATSSTLLEMLDPTVRGLMQESSSTDAGGQTRFQAMYHALQQVAATRLHATTEQAIEESGAMAQRGGDELANEFSSVEDLTNVRSVIEGTVRVAAQAEKIADDFTDFVNGRLARALGEPVQLTSIDAGELDASLRDSRTWARIYDRVYPAKDSDPSAATGSWFGADRGEKTWDPDLEEFLSYRLAKSLNRFPNLSESWSRFVVQDWFSGSQATPYVLDQLEIYSNRSTAPEALLVWQGGLRQSAGDTSEASSEDSGGEIQEVLEKHYRVKFVSTVTRDDDLAVSLVDELQRRGVDLIHDRQHVALISEWDTFYGRALPIAMESVIQYRRGEESTHWKAPGTLTLMLEGNVGSPPRVHRFSYMRGIDGSTPQGQMTAGNEQGGMTGKKPWEVDVDEWERPVGTSGLDYMRRVADKLTKLDRELAREGERLGAIGVVGSDVYDKLLVLQALRSRFPNVVFFTTDLDARLLHPSQYDWCRNLIVASGYGLELNPQLQQHIPPFRDSYQTSTFFACLLALGAVDIDVDKSAPATFRNADVIDGDQSEATRATVRLTSACELDAYLKPQLFEIARTGAYNITPDANLSAVHPKNQDGRPALTTLMKVFGLVFVLGLLMVPLNQTLRRFTIGRVRMTKRDRETLNLFTFVAAASLIALGLVIFYDGRGGEGEPFELFEGISIWPTEFFRLAEILLSWAFITLAISNIRKSDQQLRAENIALPGSEMIREPSFWKQWKIIRDGTYTRWSTRNINVHRPMLARLWRSFAFEWRCFWRARTRISINAWRQAKKNRGQSIEISRFWSRYRELGQISNRLWRCVPLVAAYLMFGWCLTQLCVSTTVPYRGELAGFVDSLLRVVSSFSLVFLTFFIVDATRLCEVFVRELASRRTVWPETALIQDLARERGVSLDDLSEFIDIQVVARRTEVVGRLITYPFVALFLGTVSLNGYFDNWRWSVHEVLFFGLILAYAVICAVVLRNAAERARKKAVGKLQQRLSQALTSRSQKSAARAEQLQMLIEEIRLLRRGAFSPLSRHPIVRAVLIPFGGLGTVALLDLLSTVAG